MPPRLLAIGSSTGGPQALFTLVQGLGQTLHVPVVLTQHMPATFTPILAEHISKLGGLPCAEAKDGEALRAGRIYLAPGDRHLLVERTARRPAGAAVRPIRRRISAAPRSIRCCAAPPPPATAACWWRC